jgi:hypothetical protein
MLKRGNIRQSLILYLYQLLDWSMAAQVAEADQFGYTPRP